MFDLQDEGRDVSLLQLCGVLLLGPQGDVLVHILNMHVDQPAESGSFVSDYLNCYNRIIWIDDK